MVLPVLNYTKPIMDESFVVKVSCIIQLLMWIWNLQLLRNPQNMSLILMAFPVEYYVGWHRLKADIYLGDSTGTISVNEENSQSGFRPDFLIVCDYSWHTMSVDIRFLRLHERDWQYRTHVICSRPLKSLLPTVCISTIPLVGKMLLVSYCDWPLSVVRRRPSCGVRRAACVNFFT